MKKLIDDIAGVLSKYTKLEECSQANQKFYRDQAREIIAVFPLDEIRNQAILIQAEIGNSIEMDTEPDFDMINNCNKKQLSLIPTEPDEPDSKRERVCRIINKRNTTSCTLCDDPPESLCSFRTKLVDEIMEVIDNKAQGGCYDCNAPYGESGWCDVIIPDEIWNEITPENGILCFRCMTKRLENKGFKDVPVNVVSGPYKDANEEWRLIGWKHGFKVGKEEIK